MKRKWFYVLMCASIMLSLAVMPVLAAPAVDGDGMMSVSPDNAVYHSTNKTFVFTFTANNDFPSGSQVQLTIPAGWTTPKSGAGAGHIVVAQGTCSLMGSPLFAISGMTIMVDITRCLTGEQFTITYSGVTVPNASLTPYSFTTQTDIPGGDGLFTIFSGSPTVAVDPTPITVSSAGLTPGNKVYDGDTTVPTLTIGSPSLVGVVSPDVVSLDTSGATGVFDNRNIGTGKTVTITGLTLTGADSSNYTLIDPTRKANITKRSITVTAVSDSKIYDGTTTSTALPILSAGTPLGSGDTEPAWTQTFPNKKVGINKVLTPAGLVDDGNSGLNYTYNYVINSTGEITPRPITITAVADTKEYDGTVSSSIAPDVTPGLFGTDTSGFAQTFDNNAVGTSKTLTPAGLVNDGNSGNNYTYSYVTVTTGVINQRSITVTADAKSKIIGKSDPVLTYQVTAGAFVTGDTLTLTRTPGEDAGTYPITVDSFPAKSNYDLTYVGADLTITPIVTLNSTGLEDGWILESTPTSNKGGTINSTDATFILGDDATKRQYKSILSFDTSSLPDNAVIKSVVLKIQKSGATKGSNPFSVLGGLLVDIQTGSFGTTDLAPKDFQAKASATKVGTFKSTPVGGWYTVTIGSNGRNLINTVGLTQFRLYFTKGDNGNLVADYMQFLSGDSSTGQPQLIIKYTLP